MISSFYKKFSLDNLKENKPAGQIATLLILIIVVVLFLILATVNLGQLSLSSTSLSNVADSSALLLASQLATRAHQISQSLGSSGADDVTTVSACQNVGEGGFWGALGGALTGAIYGWNVGGPPGAIVGGIIGGITGGMAGSRMSGTSVTQGAFQGAIIGAAVGAAVASVGTSMEEAGDAAMTEAAMEQFRLGKTAEEINAAADAAALAAGPSTLAIANAGLFAASTLYNASAAEQNQSAAFSAASRMLNGLPDYDRMRQSVILQALLQTVDDPKKDPDTDDLNGNGITDEKVPHFLYWWADYIQEFTKIIPDLQNTTSAFASELRAFKDYINQKISVMKNCEIDDDNRRVCYDIVGDLSRGDGVDGPVAKLGRGLENTKFAVNYWKPGDPDPKLDTYHDGLDALTKWFQLITKEIEAVENMDNARRTSSWQSWFKWFYDPETSGIKDYDVMFAMINGRDGNPGIDGWIADIQAKQASLPFCSMGYNAALTWWEGDTGGFYCNPCPDQTKCSNECITNEVPAPCKFPPSAGSAFPGTVDQAALEANTMLDDFKNALTVLNDVKGHIQGIMKKITDYDTDMTNIYNSVGMGKSGPSTYAWADSRCPIGPDNKPIECHSVSVDVADFKIPTTIKTTSSNGTWSKTICINLIDYCSGPGCQYGDKGALVTITRSDPEKDEKFGGVNLAGMWNPFAAGTITKRGKAYYDLNKVELAK